MTSHYEAKQIKGCQLHLPKSKHPEKCYKSIEVITTEKRVAEVSAGGLSQTPWREMHFAITQTTKGLLAGLRAADKGRCVW